jgi:hypothetical protein
MKEFTVIILVLIITPFSFIKAQKVQGRITDAATNQPIIGASVAQVKAGKGTITNEDGEFELNVDILPVDLQISHVSYGKTIIQIQNNQFKKIALNLAAIQLAEVTTGNPAVALLNAVIRKAERDSVHIYLKKAFYQKSSQYAGNFTKLHEVFMNVEWKSNGMVKWQPTNSRYAEVERMRFNHQNSMFISFFETSIYKKHVSFPLNQQDIAELHEFRITNYINEGTENEVAVISCRSLAKKSYQYKRFEGTFYVLTKHDALLKVTGTFIHPKTKRFKAQRQIEISFEPDENNRMVFKNSYQVETSVNRLTRQKNVDKMWLYFIDDVEKFTSQKTYPAYFLNDMAILEGTTYDPVYWKNNVPIKHTKTSAEAIKSFEDKKLFKSNFQN